MGAAPLRATLRVRQALPGFTAKGRRSLSAALGFLLLAGAAAAELTSNEEIRTATFVDLGFDQFPSLPPNVVPDDGALWVSPAGSDEGGDGSATRPWRTLAHALEQARSGDTLVVREGRYAEEELSLSTDGVTVMGAPGEPVRVVPAGGGRGGFAIRADHLVLRGLAIEGFADFAVLLDGERHDLVLADLEILGSAEGITKWDGDTVSRLLVHNVSIVGAAIGLQVGGGTARHWRVEDVRIDNDPRGDWGWGADAFAIENGDDILLVDTEVSGAASDGIDTKATRVVLYRCRVHDVGHDGVKLWHGGDVIDTLIYRAGGGVVVEQGERFRLLHSVVTHNTAEGFYNLMVGYDTPSARTRVEIIDSIVFDTTNGAWIRGACPLTISHSLFFGMGNGSILDYGEITVELADGAAGLAALGPGNLVEDPQLDDTYRPRPGSPVIDRGIALAVDYPLTDLDGRPRVAGAAPDLGAFENGRGSGGPACSPGPEALCLARERFRVEVDWSDGRGGTGRGHVVPHGSDHSGLFWFFRPGNWEVLVKVLAGCGVNGYHWVFFAATTNVGFTVTVTDTAAGRVRRYANPLGQPADAVMDTAALPCP